MQTEPPCHVVDRRSTICSVLTQLSRLLHRAIEQAHARQDLGLNRTSSNKLSRDRLELRSLPRGICSTDILYRDPITGSLPNAVALRNIGLEYWTSSFQSAILATFCELQHSTPFPRHHTNGTGELGRCIRRNWVHRPRNHLHVRIHGIDGLDCRRNSNGRLQVELHRRYAIVRSVDYGPQEIGNIRMGVDQNIIECLQMRLNHAANEGQMSPKPPVVLPNVVRGRHLVDRHLP